MEQDGDLGDALRLVERLAATARVADQGGVEWFTVMDHWFQMEGLGPEKMCHNRVKGRARPVHP